jgi:hypothetical protein
MVLFGGIYEITKELNDFYLFDLINNRWITIFEESVSPKKGTGFGNGNFSTMGDEQLSPFGNQSK